MNTAPEKPYSCNVDGCGKRFSTKGDKDRHRKDKHGKARHFDKKYAPRRPMAGMHRDDVYGMVEAMDLPDGAHWAMIEELSGLEPGDFV